MFLSFYASVSYSQAAIEIIDAAATSLARFCAAKSSLITLLLPVINSRVWRSIRWYAGNGDVHEVPPAWASTWFLQLVRSKIIRA